ncbi:MAG: tryptophan synthase subunit alpha [Chloroflexi bacterium]|nr:tryptophan synthase subunit alpha [Chloroflexota bacterium]
MTQLSQLFESLHHKRELGLLPYLTAGFPDLDSSLAVAEAMLAGGADAIELGIPFSDPMADGLTLQRANERALAGGATPGTALALARHLTERIPVLFMSYYNPVLAFGEQAFCGAAAEAGASGLIVPDLPPEESESLRKACVDSGLDYIYMLGPTSTPERIEIVARLARGFIYCVALVGVTGARAALADELDVFLSRVRAAANVPLVLGFGISQPEHVRAVHERVDGVIVASALADLVESTPAAGRTQAVTTRVAELKAATRRAAEPVVKA